MARVGCTWIVTSPLLTNIVAFEVKALVLLHRDPTVVIDAPPRTSMRSSPVRKGDFVQSFNKCFPIKSKLNCIEDYLIRNFYFTNLLQPCFERRFQAIHRTSAHFHMQVHPDSFSVSLVQLLKLSDTEIRGGRSKPKKSYMRRHSYGK